MPIGIKLKDSISVLLFANSVIDTTEIAGSGNWVISLINAFKQSDVNISVSVAFHDPKAKRIEFINKDGINLIRIPLNGGNSLLNKFLTNWLVIDRYKFAERNYQEIIQSVNPDIIQIFGLESPYIRILGKTAQPTIIHLQGIVGPTRYKIYLRIGKFERIRATRLIDLLFNASFPFIERIRNNRKFRLEKSKYDMCEYFLGRTDWDRRCVRAFSPQAKYFYCQEIMRPEFYLTDWVPSKKSIVRLFSTIRQGPIKNIDIVFDVALILETYNPDFKYEWFVAGVYDSDIIPKIMKNRGVKPKHLHMLGSLRANEIIEEINKSDLFIYPSAIENSSNAIQEAMLVGIPIIATFAGGTSTIIENGITGYLVQDGEPYSLAGTILEVIENYDNAIDMAKKAKAVARQRNNPESVVESLNEVYRTIMTEENK
jgi:glycosyltransferase involved in cell wall biosynthesis